MKNHKPRISVVIPVLNEPETLPLLLQDLNRQDMFLEVIVVDGNGETVSCILPGLYPNLRIRTCVSEKGRGLQMKKGAALASCPVLWFLHSDTRLPSGSALAIENVLRSRNAGAGAFDLKIETPEKIFRIIGAAASFRSRLTRVPYGDQGIFVRKSVYLRVGGMDRVPILEDVLFMKKLGREGVSVRFTDQRIESSPRRWREKGALRVTLRNRLIMLAFLMGVSPDRAARWYYR